MKNRIVVLLMLLGLLCLTSMQSANADAGGACLGQWSECRAQCEARHGTNPSTWLSICYMNCDEQRNNCLSPSPVSPPVN